MEKDSMVVEKDRMVAEKDRMVEEKDKRIEEKDKTIAVQDVAVAAAQESSDRATALARIKETYQGRKWGSVTRTKAWKTLDEDGRVVTQELLPEQRHPRKRVLASKFSELKPETWKAERDMYRDIIPSRSGEEYQKVIF